MVTRRGARVRIDGMAELRAKVNDPALFVEPMQEMLTEASRLGQRVAVHGVDGGRGIAVRSIMAYVNPASSRVITVMPKARADSIEKGRKAGINPRTILAQILNWKNAAGLAESAIEIAVGIARRGVKGRFFMKAARDAVENDMPRLLGIMSQRIEERWKR